jgi:diadenosine tetraphosphate (Ap4A) HIT family hydrolase
MCADGRPDEKPHGIRFLRGENTDAYLGRHAPARGYAFVVWRGPHVAEPTELDRADASAFWLEMLSAARLIEIHFNPCKLNYEVLGNGVPHLHAHIVPRYVDDVAPGRPLPSECWLRGDVDPVPDGELRRDAEALRLLAERGRS